MGELEWVYGRNPVLEAIKAGRELNKILVAKGTKLPPNLMAVLRESRVPFQEVTRERLDSICGTSAHQGVAVQVAAASYVDWEEILAQAEARGEQPLLILLDELEDPHNLGAILRTAEGAGVHGVIIPKRRNVGLTGTVAKAAAGAVEYVPVARVSNLVQIIRELKEKGVWVAGLDGEAEKSLWEQDLTGPLALVVGGEGKGLSRLVKENCDFLIKIPMSGKINSLNASVATAICVYEVLRQRQRKA
ncbi:23S rRNA (guanosine2251-2'-O)-methyltransferase [Carboxydocella sporoproducens DSM 16521]|uniref:23S rRNA (Guanosine2251-2'-O)-methyltransferase n=2 Tax=Carboxydocella TaxID=178898 RepID=A0A1T4SPH1_9FIRM|nr:MULTISPECIES: 23S rRNA (guanosine(2251)-2'-O)-methyltransferase RlmB [Carboxydocella]AVX21827.1 23S rRNA (guanosine2251-2'-O)-methyltransferase [Carboxydocella thermautotrophica]AVX32229.1 23S rRNA (guanosine2251-2'-O)-methyltransferase [Carboxydocella thermautotrophica]GAW28472.1 23S rRNA (guanosine(2251)-2'-O)-methyltransferase RlmB [Carboxydocella sp. ULO1]SKA30067.1 23S rRNA (guanosine2251-2'-O)-methyltransferase [Carboxydocella sporoproducens DSM 16521]